jgi:succinate dehydrogenase / fumarate reductase iron-sulfur subunit
MATKKKAKGQGGARAPEGEAPRPAEIEQDVDAASPEQVSAEETRERAYRDPSDDPPEEPEAKLPAALAKAVGSGKKVRLKIRRQDAREAPDTRRWEEFEVPYLPQMNVHSALEQVRKNPVTVGGQTVAPPVWEAACLEEVCGSCTMLVNGRVRQACSTLVDAVAPKGETIVLEPMSKFPCERDLVVDRSRMFDALKRVKAWIEIDGTHALGPGPRESQAAQAKRYPLSRCMTCGSCLEACPQVTASNEFVGAAALNQVHLMNLHPTGSMQKRERLEAVMGDGGVEDCGKAQNCVEVCPKEIPLVDSIGAVARDTTKELLFGWLFE